MDRSYVPTVSSGTCMAERPTNITRSCGTVRDNYGALLRSYDKNNDDRIDIDELGDAGEDFAQGEISREQLEAVSFAFNNNCSVPPKQDPPDPDPPENKPPNAEFTISPQTGTAPFTATFDANPSNDPDGSITDYFWEFPSGEQRKGKQIEKRFTEDDVGTVAVELAVLDDDGNGDTTTKSVTVNPPKTQPPVDIGDIDDELLAQAAILGVGIAPSVIY